MQKKFPDDPNEFNELMLRIDSQLSAEGIKIFRRPSYARRTISKEFGITFVLPFESKEQQRIGDWYKLQYGDRLKINPIPGRMAFLINNDVWVFRFPIIGGTFQIVAANIIRTSQIDPREKLPILNVLDSIEHLPEGLCLSLTDKQLEDIRGYFILGYEALLFGLNFFRKDVLISSARADIDVSINHMVNPNPEYGLSKWSSLQASERILKTLIERLGEKYPNTHVLSKLVKIIQEKGIELEIDNLIGKIQCNAAIRYGQEPCTLLDAIDAHHAVFKVAMQVIKELQRLKQ